MKKIITVILSCLIIAGAIVTGILGFNVGTKYAEQTQIGINVGKSFELNEIKQIANEVFEGKTVLVQYVELYKDMVQITVKGDVTSEQVESLNTKINEKYETENKVEDVEVLHNANTKLKDLVKPYIAPIASVTAIIAVYTMIVFRKQGAWKVLYTICLAMVIPQVVIASLYAVTRLPINRITPIICLEVYIISIMLTIFSLEKKSEVKE